MQKLNYLIIMGDSLRVDHAYNKSLMPALNDFIDTYCVRFTRAYTTAPWTLAANASALSGLHPHELGVQGMSRNEIMDTMRTHPDFYRLPADDDWLPEELKECGYYTTAKVAGGYISHRHGFARSFDDFRLYDWVYLDAPVAIDVLKVAGEIGKPWFFYSQDYSTHEAHGPWPRFNKFASFVRDEVVGLAYYMCSREAAGLPLKYQELVKHYYRDSCRQYDIQLEILFEYLKTSGLLENTMVFFMSDHGEELWSHGWGGHAHTVYDDVLRIPLACHFPGCVPYAENRLVSVVDVAPTILGLPFFGNGVNLFTMKRKYAYAEVEFKQSFDELPLCAFAKISDWWRKEAMVSGDFKILRSKKFNGDVDTEYYDLAKDPVEQEILLGSESLMQRYPQIEDIEMFLSLCNDVERGDYVERVAVPL